MRVLMLNPPFHPRFSRSQRSPAKTRSGNLYYPIWLGYATGSLEQVGHCVRLIDAPAAGLSRLDVCAFAHDFQPQLIVIETSTPSIINDLEVAAELRASLNNPIPFIVLVGTHASALPRETLEQANYVDAIARREFDHTLRDLSETLEAGGDLSSVTGITYRDGDQVCSTPDRPELQADDLDSLPFLSQVWTKHVNIEQYFYSITPHPQVTLVTGRGCPYKCDFCVWPQVLTGHGYRRRSVENVVEEFLWIDKNLPGVHVFLEDDTLTVNRKRCQELAQALQDSGSRVKFTANSRADVDFDTLRALQAAGLRMVCVGFESSENDILAGIEKRLQVEQAHQFVADAKRAKVLVHGCFMVGNPGETHATLRRTLDYARQISPDSAQFFPLMVYPGTRAFDKAVKDGSLVSKDWSRWLRQDGTHNTVINRPMLSSADLIAWCNSARREFYFRPSFLAKKVRQSIADPHERYRNLRAAKELCGHLVGS